MIIEVKPESKREQTIKGGKVFQKDRPHVSEAIQALIPNSACVLAFAATEHELNVRHTF